MPRTLFSIVIQNFNYANFLRRAIESSLNQSYQDLEVIVVDDGSTDGSRDMILSFGTAVRPIFKPNGGQASAMNRGFAESSGDYILFLDADDFLFPSALDEHAIALETGAVRSQAYMDCVDVLGNETGDRIPGHPPPDGDALAIGALDVGPGAFISSPASGNAWRRSALLKIFPLPETSKTGADAFLLDAAPLLGATKSINSSLAAYRKHAESASSNLRAWDTETLKRSTDHFLSRLQKMESVARSIGFDASKEKWIGKNWRLQTLLYFLSRQPSGYDRPSIRRHVLSAMKSPFSFKQIAIASCVLTIRALPSIAAQALARRVVKLHYM
jgi:hypothetical protein